ncbi:hypothetical protein CVT25_005212 [Psilocybe cyanescens]|uniref:Uncharacterized protein n=1 Tax=Psilocybe cyanescens TaxID=93625 RepID=A0A409XS35_PSICY|nr:hypothetical protein CVT25_005212 [Psilocybe cyanescens]
MECLPSLQFGCLCQGFESLSCYWIVANELGCIQTWERQNVCLLCLYEVENELKLKFDLLAAMDGNNSLMLIDSTFYTGSVHTDTPFSTSGQWILPDEVDIFKDKVKQSSNCFPPHKKDIAKPDQEIPIEQAPPSDHPSSDRNEDLGSEEIAWLNVSEHNNLAKCLDTLKNAGPKLWKKIYALFVVAEIFLSVCHYGHLLVICDMIHSGELMKYPLAIINQLLQEFRSDICLAYEIMCDFTVTLKKSILSEKVRAFCFCGVISAFYDHAYNCGCQVQWHPLYIEGVGLEGFKECKHTFCCSNKFASVTHLAMPY